MSKKKYFTAREKQDAKNAIQRKCNPGWYKRHKEEILKRSAIQSRTIKSRYTRLCYIAKKKGLEINVTIEDFAAIAKLPCFYCGGPLSIVGHSLDRINSDIGYLMTNVRPCCKRCNLAKNDMTETEFREWIFRIFHHWAKGGL